MPKSHPHFASDWLGIGGFGVKKKSPSTVSLKQLNTRLIRVALISIHHPFTFSSTGPTENFRVLAFKTRDGKKKLFQFLPPSQRQIARVVEAGESRHFDRNRNQPIVPFTACRGPAILFQANYSQCAALDHYSWKSRQIAKYDCIERIAIGRACWG